MLRIPRTPPDFHELLAQFFKSRGINSFPDFLEASLRPELEDRYYHWDKLRHLRPPLGLSHEEWWVCLKLRRGRKAIPMRDKDSNTFGYALADQVSRSIREIDLRSAGTITVPGPITDPDTRDRYIVKSLIDEAITSSQLEGAATTRPVARDMIRSGRQPRDRSEQMILNNYRTMQQIRKLQDEPLSKQMVLDLHKLVTTDTLDKPDAAGRFRYADEEISVGDDYGQTFHVPPPADQLDERVDAMCAFANGETPNEFVHPAVRSIILHFWLAYDHPFVDGNGRTARALFYWSMLHNGFWLCEFISISEIILKGPSKYARAFLYTETDGNDLTYFLLYHLDILKRAFDRLFEYIERKTRERKAVESKLHGLRVLNHRQQALIGHALRHPEYDYTIESHRVSHNVVYETARTDLLDLADRGLVEKRKVAREWHFTPVAELERKLSDLD